MYKYDEIEFLKNHVKELERSEDQKTFEIEDLKSEIESLRAEIKELKQNGTNNSDEKLINEIRGLSGKNDALHYDLENAHANIRIMKEKNKELEIQIIRLKKDSVKEKNPLGAGRKEFKDLDIIEDIFNMYTNNCYSMQDIADTLNRQGITTQNKKEWSKASIRIILNNVKYRGKVISESQFDKVKKRALEKRIGLKY